MKSNNWTPRIVVLSSCNPPSNLSIAPLLKKYGVKAIIQPIAGARKQKSGRWKRIAKNPLQYAVRVFNAKYLSIFLKTISVTIQKLSEHEKYTDFNGEFIKVPWEDINLATTKKILQDLNPEILIVNAAPILSKELFEIASIVSVNIHYGIIPDYRGEHTIFWPMLNGKFDKIGASIHKVVHGVDSGEVYVEAYPRLNPEDTEATLYVKSATTIGECLVDFIDEIVKQKKLPQGFKAKDTTKKSKLIYYRSRMPYHDLAFWVLRKLGLRKIPPSKERIVHFYDKQMNHNYSDFESKTRK